jgi:hypothetical protein
MKTPMDFFYWYFIYGDIYQLNFFIVNSIGKHRRKYIIDIYQENRSQNRKNKKKSNNAMTCKLLQMQLPIQLQWDLKK